MEDWKEKYLQSRISELNVRVENLENENMRLVEEIKNLKAKDKISQETIRYVQQIEFEYRKSLDELMKLKEKCRKIISQSREVKTEYTQKMNAIMTDARKIRKGIR